jgi:tetratricopeptide (TPR) repeat protein
LLNKELSEETYEKITELCEKGNELTEENNFEEALKIYLEALKLLPEPKNQWEASSWINSVIGDTYFILKNYKEAKEYFYDALNYLDSIDNPFINLRLGQTLYELKEYEKAKEYLQIAFMLEGYEIFFDEDKKYFKLIENI